jgi:hypothetical protein
MVQAVRFRLMELPPERDVIVPVSGSGPEEETGMPRARGGGNP